MKNLLVFTFLLITQLSFAQDIGYKVQFMALSNNNQVFSDVQQLGQVQIEYSPNLNIYRYQCGNMTSRNEAEALLNRIKSLGYHDAFIVTNSELVSTNSYASNTDQASKYQTASVNNSSNNHNAKTASTKKWNNKNDNVIRSTSNGSKTNDTRPPSNNVSKNKATDVSTTGRNASNTKITDTKTTVTHSTENKAADVKSVDTNTSKEKNTAVIASLKIKNKDTEIKGTVNNTSKGKTTDVKTTVNNLSKDKSTDVKTTVNNLSKDKTTDVKTTVNNSSKDKSTDVKTTVNNSSKDKTTDIKTTVNNSSKDKSTDVKTTVNNSSKDKTTDIKTTASNASEKKDKDDFAIAGLKIKNKDTANTQEIPTVNIGDQIWMARSLNVGTMINGKENMTNNDIIEKYCYDNKESNCSVYGALYQWDEVMQYATAESTQGLCPVGFHIPSDEEWKRLEIALGMDPLTADKKNTLRGTNHWNQLASNKPLWKDSDTQHSSEFGSSGFASLPGGFRYVTTQFRDRDKGVIYWSSSKSEENRSWYRDLSSKSSGVGRSQVDKSYGCYIRCVKDSETK